MIVCHWDLDGGASAICIINHIKQKYGIYAEYKVISCGYEKVDMIVERIIAEYEKYEKVFIADISVSPELASEFPDNVLLLDHHDTAKPLENIKNCIIDTSGNHCGASLCYKYLLKNEGLEYQHLKKLVAIALDYDLWHHKLPKNIAKNLNFIYYMYWDKKFIDRFINGFDKFNEQEVEFLKNKWLDIENQIKTTDFIDVMADDYPEYKNKVCLIIIPGSKGEVNELCEHALNKLKYNVVMTVIPQKFKISTRIDDHAANKGLHIGEFHSELKIGGGHPKAGGANYNDDAHLEFICEKLAEKIIKFGI